MRLAPPVSLGRAALPAGGALPGAPRPAAEARGQAAPLSPRRLSVCGCRVPGSARTGRASSCPAPARPSLGKEAGCKGERGPRPGPHPHPGAARGPGPREAGARGGARVSLSCSKRLRSNLGETGEKRVFESVGVPPDSARGLFIESLLFFCGIFTE